MSQVGPDQQRLSPAERANLVAYLDGELNEAESQAIATKLTRSATARREVEVLQKTWELLEHLPLPKASEDFTERTLTGARNLAEHGGRFETAFVQAARRFLRASAWVAASMAAFGVGVAVARWVWPDPSERLARDLPVAEHLDEYREVGDFGYLEELVNSPEFSTDRGD
jgi:anti-sigma factor RsiW